MMRGNKLLLAMTALTVWGFSGVASAAPFFTESFDNVPAIFAGANPWVQDNNSNPPGTGVWEQYTTTEPPIQTLPFIFADYSSVSVAGTISNWLISPLITFENNDVITFFTQTEPGAPFPDNMQVRLNTNDTTTDVGNTESSVGSFTNMLLEINPYDPINGYQADYPDSPTKFTLTVTGLSGPTQGRLAFRYYVINGGEFGDNSTYVTVDNLNIEHVPEPTALVMGAGVWGMALMRRRSRAN
jgi:hypothetical protein